MLESLVRYKGRTEAYVRKDFESGTLGIQCVKLKHIEYKEDFAADLKLAVTRKALTIDLTGNDPGLGMPPNSVRVKIEEGGFSNGDRLESPDTEPRKPNKRRKIIQSPEI
jgi:hypothetical protein